MDYKSKYMYDGKLFVSKSLRKMVLVLLRLTVSVPSAEALEFLRDGSVGALEFLP
jgi:hypothetical protein